LIWLTDFGRRAAHTRRGVHFLSGLCFRGKLAYASHFGRAKQGLPRVLVITSGRGLLTPETVVRVEDLRAFASVPVDWVNYDTVNRSSKTAPAWPRSSSPTARLSSWEALRR
jgi:hypothetical protein